MGLVNCNRRDFLKRSGLAAMFLSVGGCLNNIKEARSKKKPNVLWIISEDTSPDIGCYGEKLVRTPNIDRLASEGIRFNNAFASGPVCSASRSALITGMYQTSIGAHNHRSHRRDDYRLPEPVKVVSEYFRKAGYYTCNLRKTDFNFNVDNPFDGKSWDGRKEGQPFFAIHNIFLTHRDFRRDKKRPINPDDVKLPPYYPDHPVVRRDWADYLESVQLLDGQIGEVLEKLEAEGLADNTIVIYFGDHGRPHVRGKQWLYEGGIRVPLIVRWPRHIKAGGVSDDLVSLIDVAPTSLNLAGLEVPSYMEGKVFLGKGAKRRKMIFAARDRCDETVDHIRCVRTKRYKYIRNFMPERSYTQFNQYKMCQYPALTVLEVLHKEGRLTAEQTRFMAKSRPKEELYDLKKDPYELCNLADNPDFKKVLTKLRGKLDKWIKETNDQGEIAEKAEVIKYWEGKMRENYIRKMKERGLSLNATAEARLKYWEKRLL